MRGMLGDGGAGDAKIFGPLKDRDAYPSWAIVESTQEAKPFTKNEGR